MQPTKFIHMADCHLGFKQYRLNERFIDYNKAFNAILKRALKEEVDFILIAGDLFNSTNVNPETLTAIYQMISIFKEQALIELKRDIPLICIEGNHDKVTRKTIRANFLENLISLYPLANVTGAFRVRRVIVDILGYQSVLVETVTTGVISLECSDAPG